MLIYRNKVDLWFPRAGVEGMVWGDLASHINNFRVSLCGD